MQGVPARGSGPHGSRDISIGRTQAAKLGLVDDLAALIHTRPPHATTRVARLQHGKTHPMYLHDKGDELSGSGLLHMR